MALTESEEQYQFKVLAEEGQTWRGHSCYLAVEPLPYTLCAMNSSVEERRHPSLAHSETLYIAAILTLSSVFLMLRFASPELTWDEADYATATANGWHSLWSDAGYARHGHGPLMIYLAKLGESVWLPVGSLETRLRFFNALVGSIAIGFLYWTLRSSFGTSRAAALAGSSLLLFSVIRLRETPVFGPHHLILTCTLMLAGLGYQWRDRPSFYTGLALGGVIAFGALSMTYVIPVALCWFIAVALTGKNWVAWNGGYPKPSWYLLMVLVSATVIVLILWPPGVLQHVILSNFHWYMHYPYGTTIVADRVVAHAPRWAAFYWLAHLDAVVLVVSTVVIFTALWRAFKSRSLTAKHGYLSIWVAFLLGIALAAHLSGTRNLLLFIGAACLATGALFDEALAYRPRQIAIGGGLVAVAAAMYLLFQWRTYTPVPGSAGYRAFLSENADRLHESAHAMAFNVPALQFYARQTGTLVNWKVDEAPWTPSADIELPADMRYVLLPGFFKYMPPDQPMRRVVADHWKVVWVHKEPHAYELRLYENPSFAAP